MSSKTESQSTGKSAQVQSQVNEVVDIMQTNMTKAMQRGEQLDVLATKSESLAQSSSHFKSGATRVKRAMFWQRVKIYAIVGSIALVILVIILIITLKSKDEKPAETITPVDNKNPK